jgi:transposase-like protein
MVQLLEKGEQNPSQISRDHHVTLSLLYVWWQLYRERGEGALMPTQAFQSPPEVDRPSNAEEHIAHLERLCGQQALERGSLRSPGCCAKKSLALGLATGSHPSRDTP